MKDPSSSIHVTVFLFFNLSCCCPITFPDHALIHPNRKSIYNSQDRLSCCMLWRDDHTLPYIRQKPSWTSSFLPFFFYWKLLRIFLEFFFLWLCKVIHHARPELKTHGTPRKKHHPFLYRSAELLDELSLLFLFFLFIRDAGKCGTTGKKIQKKKKFFSVWDYW